MRFEPLEIAGAIAVHLEQLSDSRGFFMRTACSDEFGAQGMARHFSQSSISFNYKAGTLRGMHYSVGAGAETKLVRCTAGAVLDVLVDVRQGSVTFGRTLERVLDAKTKLSLYIPHGVAHGFQTLENDSELLYMIDVPFFASAGRGFRWNDAIVSTTWPLPISEISERDATYPDFSPDSGR